MLFIESARLKLIPLTFRQLLLSNGNMRLLEKDLGLTPSNMVIDGEFKAQMDEAMQNFWLPNTQAYPDLYPWYTNWQVVLKSSNTIIGGIGFGGYPDDYGQTTVGYVICQTHQNKGYATEVLTAIMKWGFSFSILKALNADTPAGNKASQKTLLKAGFKQTHVQDGLVYFSAHKNKLQVLA